MRQAMGTCIVACLWATALPALAQPRAANGAPGKDVQPARPPATAQEIKEHALRIEPQLRQAMARFQAVPFRLASGHELPYLLFCPADRRAGAQYPLVLTFGDNLWATATWALPANQRRFPAFVAAVQCGPQQASGGQEASAAAAMEVLDSLLHRQPIDSDRLYVTGVSGDAACVWTLIVQHPDFFAAAVPVGGAGEPDKAPRVAGHGMAVWAFQGEKDAANPVDGSRAMVAALKQAGADVRYTEYPDAGGLTAALGAYTELDLPAWVFSKGRSAGPATRPAPGPASGTTLGILAAKGEDWVEIKSDGEQFPLRYAAGELPNLADLVTGNLVRAAWAHDDHLHLLDAEVVVPPAAGGRVAGIVTAKKTAAWLDVKPDRGGPVERYTSRWSASPDIPDEDELVTSRILWNLKPGDPVDLSWTYGDRKRIGRFYGPALQARTVQYAYLTFLPKGYDKTAEPWPMIVSLHGSSGKGGDPQALKDKCLHGLAARNEAFPFVVITPQCPEEELGWEADSVLALVKEAQGKYRIDPARVYLTGVSMGGASAWHVAAKFPRAFAAVAPIGGGGSPGSAESLKDVPVWAFAGERDEVVVDGCSRLVASLQKAGGEAKLTVFPNVGHACWHLAYTNDLFDWLLAHKLPPDRQDE